MNIKKTLLILTIATTMCACKDNANTEPEPIETSMFDTTFVGEDTMIIKYKDWVPLDWSEFDSAWAASTFFRNTEFTKFYGEYYDSIDITWKCYYDTINVIKNDSAQIKKIFNDLWNQYKKYVYDRCIKDSDNVWWNDNYNNTSNLKITLKSNIENYYRICVSSGDLWRWWEGQDSSILNRKVRVRR